MTPRRIALIAILAFILVVLGLLALMRLVSMWPDAAGTGAPADRRVVVYYFHRAERCPACALFESHTSEALQSGFAEDVRSGRVQWKVVDYDAPENQHFVKEFNLEMPSLILVALDGDRQRQWKNLTPELAEVMLKKDLFIERVQREVRAMLE